MMIHHRIAAGMCAVTVRCSVGLAASLLLVLQACANRQPEPVLTADPSAPESLAAVRDSPAPPGVDKALWSRLTAELARVIEREGTLRRTTAVPAGPGSSVPDLSQYSGAGMVVTTWSYRQHGDYDLNCNVTISDLTPVGIHFGANTLSPDWQTAQLADGDGNGEVNINDVTPIGQNFSGHLDGYELQSRVVPDGPWELIEEFPAVAGDPPSGSYPRYSLTHLPVVVHYQYRVVPYSDEGAERAYGPESNIFDNLASFGNQWLARRCNERRDGRSSVFGPETDAQTWTLPLTGMAPMAEPVVDMTGTIYLGMLEADTIDAPVPGSFYAVNPDGSLRWRFRTVRGFYTSAAVNRCGGVVAGDVAGHVYFFAPDGKLLWTRQLAGPVLYGGPLTDRYGGIYIVSHVMTGAMLTSSVLNKLDADGTVAWTRPLDNVCSAAPFFNGAGEVTTVDEQGDVYAFGLDGVVRRHFSLPDPPSGTLNSGGIAARGDDLVYLSEPGFLRYNAYDDTANVGAELGEDPVTSPAFNVLGQTLFGTESAEGINRLNCWMDDVQLWAMDLPGTAMTNQATDAASRTFVGTFELLAPAGSPSNGIHCLRVDRTTQWFHPTGALYPTAVIVAADDLLVCVLAQGYEPPVASLLGIRGG